MTALADVVLPLIRTRADVWRWNVANAHGARMHEAVAILQHAAQDGDPAEVFAVTQRAIASALKVIMRADDSSGIIGDACRDLLELHSSVAARARPAAAKLVDWMVKFQFDNHCDYFTIDPVAYAPALGADGMAAYRAKLDEHAATLGPRPPDDQPFSSPHAGAWFTLDWNARRLAVFDRDVDAIIATHARGLLWLRGSRTLRWHSPKSGRSTPRSTGPSKPPTSTPALRHGARPTTGANCWPSIGPTTCWVRGSRSSAAGRRRAAQVSCTGTPGPPGRTTATRCSSTWSDLAKAYEKLDPIAVLPVYTRLVERELVDADARRYLGAARRLKKMRKLAAGSRDSAEVDEFIADLRETYRRRPRLQQEFDQAGLP
ncbi:DUF6880 family protein [Mycobacterium sp. pUA109]|uniref:DUF6880 family protein n=1 Tax=Mycobacterium sp. pUA109 TaxID=3238982 RepID=UPI00351B7CDB